VVRNCSGWLLASVRVDRLHTFAATCSVCVYVMQRCCQQDARGLRLVCLVRRGRRCAAVGSARPVCGPSARDVHVTSSAGGIDTHRTAPFMDNSGLGQRHIHCRRIHCTRS